ncbi:hypothetical protein PMAYCL1PPCAC_07338 [Pristionchus mayeri]|uniref:Uncharacterized protein n=1 Tax=Pristionchus mayeri TaxID=1317129 RepID=A0AAN5C4M6_9BILA|nr:hypothetical protein PMAYCL1PPCAC_07338 [Pristionchus mayeri]
MPHHHHHHSFIHHDSLDFKEQAIHPNTIVHGQDDEETKVTSWMDEGVLRCQINGGVIHKFPILPGPIKRLGVEGGTVYLVVTLESNESALYKIKVPSTGEEMRVSFVRSFREDDHFGVNGLWMRKCGKTSYANRLSEEREGVLIDTEGRINLGEAHPIAIHRFCLIYYKKSKCNHPKMERISPNIILLEHNEEVARSESEWMFQSPVFALDHSPILAILTIAGNVIFVDVDTLTAEVIKKKYESAGIRAIFKGVNSFRRVVGVFGDSIVVEADVIAGTSAHSSSFKVFKARLPPKYRDISKKIDVGVESSSTDPDPVQLVRYVQYLDQCSECQERECLFTSQSVDRRNHQNTNFEKKKKGMEKSYEEIMNKLNDRFKVKKFELFAKSSTPSEYCTLWDEFVERRKLAKEEFDEAMNLMAYAKSQMR